MNLCTLKTIKEEDFSNIPFTGSEVDHESDEIEEGVNEEEQKYEDEAESEKEIEKL